MQGDDAGRIYFIRKGRVRAYYVTSQGRELTYEIIEKGRIFGESSFLSQCARPVCVAAVTPVSYTHLERFHLPPWIPLPVPYGKYPIQAAYPPDESDG